MSLFTPNTDNFDNYYDKGKYLMAWRISLFFMMVFGVLFIIFSSSNLAILIAFSATFLVGLFCSIYLFKTKRYKPIYWIYAVSGSIIVNIALIYILDVIHFVDFIWIIVCVLLAFVGIGKKAGIIFLITNVLGISYFLFFSLNDHIITLQPQSTLQIFGALLEIIFSLSILAYLLHQYILFQEYSHKELEIANKKLIAQNQLIIIQNKEKTTLVKEIHHRVKNNLQIIISLLRLQKNELKSEEAKRHFSEAINRIMVMSLIHKKLYQEKELAHIDIKSYLTDLSTDINSSACLGFDVKVNITSEIKNIGLKTIVPLGLLINELMTNSIKHAFFKKKEGLITIAIAEGENHNFLLNYTDNGKWIESETPNPNFGLELIEILTSQLEGVFKRTSNEEGTTYTFNIQNIDLEK